MLELERTQINSPAVFALYCEYLNHFGVQYDEKRLSALLDEVVGQDWFHLLLAKQASTYVGFCTLINNFSPVSSCLAYQLIDLFVAEQFRAGGCGSAILNALEDYAARNRVGKLFVNADANSCAFYRTQGWQAFDYIYHYKKIETAFENK